jgi:DNA excision repair protein ERCC-6
MGLGKTVEVAVFLGALQYAHLLRGAILIICPATILGQWVRELHFWAPMLRVNILHASGSHKGTASQLLSTASVEHSVVLTTYSAVRSQVDAFLSARFHYVVLDEGHHIRNPDCATAIACKAIPTPHRIIMTGTPIQNKLVELWSLFNFVHPQLLGDLNHFVNEFETPIKHGSFRGASPHQTQLAYEYSRQLKALIAPFILRRMKVDVGMTLPPKAEQVLLCKLSQAQVDMYSTYLMSPDVAWRLAHRFEQKEISKNPMRLGNDSSAHILFQSLGILRKICNHPWMTRDVHFDIDVDDITTCCELSGKLKVLMTLLEVWKREGRKAIVFSQTRTMLDIIEAVVRHRGMTHVRMDGTTPVAHRGSIIDALNYDPKVTVALMTTRVGGLGTNLIGASRVVIFDPDWNPITDVQARERVWRLGQKSDVLIYRLLCVGTVEEKVYQRQIYKLCQMESVLGNEKYKRLFTSDQLTDLFTLGPEYDDMLSHNARERFGKHNSYGRPDVPNTIKVLGGEVLPTALVTKAEDSKEPDQAQEEGHAGVLRALMDSNSIMSVACHDIIMRGAQGGNRRQALQTAQSARERLTRRVSDSPLVRPRNIPPQMPNVMKSEPS